MNMHISESFESGFLSQSLAKQIAHCDNYELAPLFLQLYKEKQPVLEAGCGSGRWCGWFSKHSIRCDGVDWSQRLCDRANSEIPQSKFIACDIKAIPLPDCSYAGVIALGSIEHTVEGPHKILREFYRLLTPEGIAVITVPYSGWLRVTTKWFVKPIILLKSCTIIRRTFGKPVGKKTLRQSKQATNPKWHPQFSHGPEGWYFYEYGFNKRHMRSFLKEASLEILEESVRFGNEGIFHNFGRIAGRWNPDRQDVDFSILGRILRKIIPVSIMGHMLCYVVTKKGTVYN